jgi:hypothetical protein
MICQEADLLSPTDEEKRSGTAAVSARLSHDDDEVMTLKQWFVRNTLSRSTGQRLIARGEGPELTDLSPGRRGVTYGADRAWKAKRRITPQDTA